MRLYAIALFPVALMGYTISATVDCGSGVIGGIGTASISCGIQLPMAMAGVFGEIESDGVEVTMQAEGPPAPGADIPTAAAFLDTDFQVTISGAAGAAFYVPCLRASGDHYLNGGGDATASAALGGVRVISFDAHDHVFTCGDPSQFRGIQPFTFGQPFLVHGTFSGNASSPGPGLGLPIGRAGLEGFVALNSDCSTGCNQSNVIPGTSVAISVVTPEPDTVILVFVSLGWLLQRRSPQRGLSTQPDGLGRQTAHTE